MPSSSRPSPAKKGQQRPPPKLPTLAPEDPLHDRFAALADFDSLLRVLQDVSEALLEACSRFLAAPAPLMKHLEDARVKASPGGKLIAHLPVTTHLQQFATTLERARPVLEEMQALVLQKQSLIARACDAFFLHDAAGAARMQSEWSECSSDATGSSPQRPPRRRGDEPGPAGEGGGEGAAALARKAQEKEEGSALQAARAADAILRQQRVTVGLVFEKLCRYYAAAFEGSHQLAQDFTVMADGLSTLPCERVEAAAPQGRGCSPLMCCLMADRPPIPAPEPDVHPRKAIGMPRAPAAHGGPGGAREGNGKLTAARYLE